MPALNSSDNHLFLMVFLRKEQARGGLDGAVARDNLTLRATWPVHRDGR
jgi:hypothetical protein